MQPLTTLEYVCRMNQSELENTEEDHSSSPQASKDDQFVKPVSRLTRVLVCWIGNNAVALTALVTSVLALYFQFFSIEQRAIVELGSSGIDCTGPDDEPCKFGIELLYYNPGDVPVIMEVTSVHFEPEHGKPLILTTGHNSLRIVPENDAKRVLIRTDLSRKNTNFGEKFGDQVAIRSTVLVTSVESGRRKSEGLEYDLYRGFDALWRDNPGNLPGDLSRENGQPVNVVVKF